MANHTTPSSPEQVRISQDVANIKRLKAWREKLAVKGCECKPCQGCGVLPGHINNDWCKESSINHIEIDDMFWGFVISISTLIISAIFVAAAYFIVTI